MNMWPVMTGACPHFSWWSFVPIFLKLDRVGSVGVGGSIGSVVGGTHLKWWWWCVCIAGGGGGGGGFRGQRRLKLHEIFQGMGTLTSICLWGEGIHIYWWGGGTHLSTYLIPGAIFWFKRQRGLSAFNVGLVHFLISLYLPFSNAVLVHNTGDKEYQDTDRTSGLNGHCFTNRTFEMK